MFCSQCGKPVAEGARFCSNCGKAIGPPAQEYVPPIPAPQETAASSATPRVSAADAESLIARVKNILLSPATEWPVIAAEATSARDIYLRFVAPLVALGVIAMFIGNYLFGIDAGILGKFRVSIASGLATAIIAYLLAFLNVFLIALLVDGLAPSFGGQRDALRALKVTVYSYAPAWVAAVLHILPGLGIVAFVAGLYGLYLLYVGLPILMRCPQDRALTFTVVVSLCAIVLWIVLGGVSALASGVFGFNNLSPLGGIGHSKVSASARDHDMLAGALSSAFGGKSGQVGHTSSTQ